MCENIEEKIPSKIFFHQIAKHGNNQFYGYLFANENFDMYKDIFPMAKSPIKEDIKVFEISAINEEGLDKVLLYMADLLDKEVVKDDFEDDLYEDYVLYTFKKENPFTIVKEKDCFVIKGDTVENLFRMTKFNTDESILRFAKKLTRMGVDEELEKMGAVQGDKVRILDFEFEYRN